MRSAATTGVACEFGFLYGTIDSAEEKTSMDEVSKPHFLTTEVRNFGASETEAIATALDESIALSEYWLGDFTPLTAQSDSRASTVAYSLSLTEQGRSVALVFRREEAPEDFLLKLPDIDRKKQYAIKLSDEERKETHISISGSELADGLALKLKKAPSSLLVYYREL